MNLCINPCIARNFVVTSVQRTCTLERYCVFFQHLLIQNVLFIYVKVNRRFKRKKKRNCLRGYLLPIRAKCLINLFAEKTYLLIIKTITDVVNFDIAIYDWFYIQSDLRQNPSKFSLTIKSF